MAELVELARQQPGKLNFSGFVGGVPQFLGEMLNRAAKINTVMVPYKSTTDALPDLLTNRIQIWFTPVASGVPIQNNKQARMLAVTGEKRARRASGRPDLQGGWAIPTSSPKSPSTCWRAKGTPQPIVDKLYRAADKALQNPKVTGSLPAPRASRPSAAAPAELSAYLDSELRRWGEIVKLSAPAK